MPLVSHGRRHSSPEDIIVFENGDVVQRCELDGIQRLETEDYELVPYGTYVHSALIAAIFI